MVQSTNELKRADNMQALILAQLQRQTLASPREATLVFWTPNVLSSAQLHGIQTLNEASVQVRSVEQVARREAATLIDFVEGSRMDQGPGNHELRITAQLNPGAVGTFQNSEERLAFGAAGVVGILNALARLGIGAALVSFFWNDENEPLSRTVDSLFWLAVAAAGIIYLVKK